VTVGETLAGETVLAVARELEAVVVTSFDADHAEFVTRVHRAERRQLRLATASSLHYASVNHDSAVALYLQEARDARRKAEAQ